MTARYILLQDCFFPPRIVKAGSKIETDMAPNPAWKPLNKEARERMELWYNEKVSYVEYDEKTGVPETKECFPHLKYRLGGGNGEAVGGTMMKVLEGPASDVAGKLSMAEALLVSRGALNSARPGPDVEVGEEEPDEPEGVSVKEEAPRDPTDTVRVRRGAMA